MRFGENGRPEIVFNREWRPICANYFNDVGARMFCNLLGFNSGTFAPTGQSYGEDSYWVGACAQGDPSLIGCTAGCNLAKSGGTHQDCAGNCNSGRTEAGLSIGCVKSKLKAIAK